MRNVECGLRGEKATVWIQDEGKGVQGTGRRIHDAGSWILECGMGILEF